MRPIYIEFGVVQVRYLSQPPPYEELYLGQYDTGVSRYVGATSPTPPGPFPYVEYKIINASFDPNVRTPSTIYTYTDSKGTHTADDNIWIGQFVPEDFVIPPIDTAPLLETTTPADDATGVAADANIVLNFNELVKAGSGNIEIHKSDGSLVASIPVTSGQVTISGKTVVINPTNDLLPDTGYYVLLSSGVIKDLTDNSFAGITTTTRLNFRTGIIAPEALFTSQSDVNVNFNALTPGQKAGLSPTTDLYHALAGDDVVTLPDANHLQLTSAVSWDTSKTFDGGPGRDVIKLTGSPGDYTVTVKFGATWEATTTRLSGSKSNEISITTTGVEQVKFLDPINNDVNSKTYRRQRDA